MNLKPTAVQVVGLALLLLSWSPPPGVFAQGGADVPPVPSEELPPGSEVLTSGPVHEAFAKPVTIQHEAGVEIVRRLDRLGSGLLGLGRCTERLHLDKRLLAVRPAQHALGARLLAPGGGRL